mmetsp:Transcript_91287/g.244442  ORF Transcript_91287/g.244442 Transcript_91287/m.244442 type:complete len:291 (+) Transcript_91287:4032-4904(+)
MLFDAVYHEFLHLLDHCSLHQLLQIHHLFVSLICTHELLEIGVIPQVRLLHSRRDHCGCGALQAWRGTHLQPVQRQCGLAIPILHQKLVHLGEWIRRDSQECRCVVEHAIGQQVELSEFLAGSHHHGHLLEPLDERRRTCRSHAGHELKRSLQLRAPADHIDAGQQGMSADLLLNVGPQEALHSRTRNCRRQLQAVPPLVPQNWRRPRNRQERIRLGLILVPQSESLCHRILPETPSASCEPKSWVQPAERSLIGQMLVGRNRDGDLRPHNHHLGVAGEVLALRVGTHPV